MKVRFTLYSGLAGDPHLLLTMRDKKGNHVTGDYSCLWNQIAPFKLWRLKRAKRKLMKMYEILNGERVTEIE